MLNEQYFTSADKVTEVRFVGNVPQNPMAVIAIAHGIGEYAGRYGEMAKIFAERGIAVYAIDFIGHGCSISDNKAPMYFGEDGWEFLVQDLLTFNRLVKKAHPDIPCIMLGFSMGSFVLREAMFKYANEIDADGAILAGTGRISGFVATLVRKMLESEAKKCGGADKVSEKVNELAFGGYNKFFTPCKTDFDWLCKNEEGIQSYIEDQFTNKFITPGMFSDLLGSMARTSKKSAIKHTKKIPILFISGKEDPVGGFVKEVAKVVEEFKKYNSDVTFMTYDETRHDLFHDNDKEVVMEDVYNWIKWVIKR